MIAEATDLDAALPLLAARGDDELGALLVQAQQLVAEATDAVRLIRAEQAARG